MAHNVTRKLTLELDIEVFEFLEVVAAGATQRAGKNVGISDTAAVLLTDRLLELAHLYAQVAEEAQQHDPLNQLELPDHVRRERAAAGASPSPSGEGPKAQS